MPKTSDFYREQLARFEVLKRKKGKLTPEERRELVTLPRPGDKTEKIRRFIDGHGFVGRELMWAKNPRTRELVPIPHTRKVSRIGMKVSPQTLSKYAKKYSMLVHVHPSGGKKKIYAGPSEGDVTTFMKSRFQSHSIIILDPEGKAVGTFMIKKTKKYLEADDAERKRFQKALQNRIKDLLFWEVNRNLGSYSYRRQIALDIALSEGNLERYGFRTRLFLDKGYKKVPGENHSTIIEKK